MNSSIAASPLLFSIVITASTASLSASRDLFWAVPVCTAHSNSTASVNDRAFSNCAILSPLVNDSIPEQDEIVDVTGEARSPVEGHRENSDDDVKPADDLTNHVVILPCRKGPGKLFRPVSVGMLFALKKLLFSRMRRWAARTKMQLDGVILRCREFVDACM